MPSNEGIVSALFSLITNLHVNPSMASYPAAKQSFSSRFFTQLRTLIALSALHHSARQSWEASASGALSCFSSSQDQKPGAGGRGVGILLSSSTCTEYE